MQPVETKNILLHLSLIEGVGPVMVQWLAQQVPNLAMLYDYTQADYMRLGLLEDTALKLFTGLADRTLLDQELDLIAEYNISWATPNESTYPHHLKHIHAPPTVLYWQGAQLTDTQKYIAIVGSRAANEYGQTVIERLVPELVAHGWTIVSGGALGADSMAHRATLDAGGITVVVVGSGLLRTYPPRNKELFKEIRDKGGTIISTFPVRMEALAGNFPARNRIISGVSRGCVVIQAAAQSGASITAAYALEQGRDVFAIPGSIQDPLSAGCHALLQQGAKVVTCAADILQEYGEIVDGAKEVQTTIIQKQVSTAPLDTSPRGIILRSCVRACSLDELLINTQLSLPELQSKLFDLQLDGVITQNFAGQWQVASK